MINKLSKITLILLSILFIAIGCKKDSDNNAAIGDDEEGINQTIAADRLNAVETEKPARSEKSETELTEDNETFTNPEDVYDITTVEGQSKVELLINGSSTKTTTKIAAENSAFAWILNSKDGVEVSKNDKYLIIFSLSGKYLKYNNTKGTAEWGYFYFNKLVTKIGFDYKNGAFENKFAVESISANELVVIHNGIKLSFKPYQMAGVASNAFTPKSNNVTTPSDSTATEDSTSTTPLPDFLKITNAETVNNIDYFTIEGNVEGHASSNTLNKLIVSYASINDTTPININIITVHNLVSDTDTSINPIALGGTDKDKFSANIEIDNSSYPTPRSYTFRLESDMIFRSLSYKFTPPVVE